jgi:hypothetical protein
MLPAMPIKSRLDGGFFAFIRPSHTIVISIVIPSEAKLRQSVCNTLTSLQ